MQTGTWGTWGRWGRTRGVEPGPDREQRDGQGMNSAEALPAASGGQNALPPGTSLLQGQYVIERFLNSGGFGITYLARDSLERSVVVKECFPAMLCRREGELVRAVSEKQQKDFLSVVRLFVREARQLAKLDHPNIVGVHQVFEDRKTAYMALDRIEGMDLLDVIEETPERLDPARVQEMLKTLLRAVGFVHEKGILHRDISPDNILLRPDDTPILIDFGAAREKATKATRALSALMVVKDGYSPQEFYIAGGEQAPSSDLYSLAASFYHVITGKAPPNSQTRLAAAAAREPDPYQPLAGRISGYPPAFLAGIDKAMRLFPKDRHPSAEAWLAEIDRSHRAKAARRNARDAQEIEQAISELVSATNRDVLEAMKRDLARIKAQEEEEAKKAEKPRKVYRTIDQLIEEEERARAARKAAAARSEADATWPDSVAQPLADSLPEGTPTTGSRAERPPGASSPATPEPPLVAEPPVAEAHFERGALRAEPATGTFSSGSPPARSGMSETEAPFPPPQTGPAPLPRPGLPPGSGPPGRRYETVPDLFSIAPPRKSLWQRLRISVWPVREAQNTNDDHIGRAGR